MKSKKLKILVILMMTIMLVIPGKAQAALPSAYQLGLSKAEVSDLTGYPIYDITGEKYTVDYREIQAPGRTTKKEKPTAQFEVLANGKVIGQSDPGRNLDAPTTVIDVNFNDKITLRDISLPYPGNKLSCWDLQYRILPVPEEEITDIKAYRSHFPIKALVDFRPELAGSKEGINTYFQEALQEMKDAYPEQDCYIELYLEVADKNKTGQEGWSDNGTYAYHKTKAMGSPYTKGHIWYFSTALLRVNAKGVPDFFPTPEGSDQWQESYKTCAKTYYYKQGESEITFPVNLFNQGNKAITDFRAVWFGQGSDPVKGWNGTSPAWQTDPVELDKGKSQTFNVTVPVPKEGEPNKLVFKCNIDGKTPASEINQENNIMIIQILQEGVDIEAILPDDLVYLINPGESVDVYIPLMVMRNDSGPSPINIDITYSGPFGSVNKQGSLAGFLVGENIAFYNMNFKLSNPGTYKVYAEAQPIGVPDINPANNKDEAIVVVKLKQHYDAGKINPDSQTRVNLRS